jgi:hypothetical protein
MQATIKTCIPIIWYHCTDKRSFQIFIRYGNTDDSLTALKALAGRKFADRTVLASFYDEQKYEADEF